MNQGGHGPPRRDIPYAPGTLGGPLSPPERCSPLSAVSMPDAAFPRIWVDYRGAISTELKPIIACSLGHRPDDLAQDGLAYTVHPSDPRKTPTGAHGGAPTPQGKSTCINPSIWIHRREILHNHSRPHWGFCSGHPVDINHPDHESPSSSPLPQAATSTRTHESRYHLRRSLHALNQGRRKRKKSPLEEDKH